ncbi:Na+/H+ antiporter NhaA [Membranicola marinus]|uniref:Na(+)/H(+) antiporter NhaA n=1 Tax=Membranihabitans marinus TaxID=1227546 RepID=A0A953LC29_9BACT|nr:Na+/H+ antiporter NhaA [Membranihabitans marinus]MBY5957329.1 Na+/H+ antiporter NhaA [Membranihabitans marinus]
MIPGKKNNLFEKIIAKDASAGIVLIISAAAALMIANSSLHDQYYKFMNLEFTFGFPEMNISKSLHHWVNDGLMALFFLLVGLEIKSELKFGRLNSFRSALFPVVAATFGATFPAIIYWFLNKGTPYIHGWAIPMATDIAFVIGIISLLGSRVPSWVKVFITTIAVVDDLIAVLIIALFYTDHISLGAFGIAGICLVLLLVLNYYNVSRLTPYLAIGFVLWWAILASGVHSTIAGVILAFTLPLHREWRLERIKAFARKGLQLFEKAHDVTFDLTSAQAHFYLENTQRNMESPLKRLMRKLHVPVYFFIMPLFAFVNAGITFESGVLEHAISSTITWGVILGLFLGKQIGILFATWILLKFVFKKMPQNKETWNVLVGIALLCGIGFTMSLFITNLSFVEEEYREFAKMGILAVSLVNGVLGYVVLRRGTVTPQKIIDDEIGT